MDGFSVWVVSVILMVWMAAKPASPPMLQALPLTETAILLPDAEGNITGIVVRTANQETSVTEPYHGVELTEGKVANKTLTADEVRRLYPEIMQALPEKPRTFILRFEENGTKLTADSLAMVGSIQQEIAHRAVPEITVIGHTDRAGSDEANLVLSVKRAEAVRDILVAGGVSAQIIQVVGRGELEPAVVTEDGVTEPLNRRVEISVR